MTPDTTTSAVWYVKSNGVVRGPFSESILISMKSAGRLAADALISAERQNWKPISILGGPFAQLEMALAGDGLPIPEANGQGPQFFLHVDGQTIGPFSPHTLQERILAGAPRTYRSCLDAR